MLKRRLRMLWLLLVVVMILGTGFCFEFFYRDRFYPGVSIGGMSVGGRTFGDVLDHFKKEEKVMRDIGLRINFEDGAPLKEVRIPMSVTGFSSDSILQYYSLGDWEAVVHQAYEFGRTGSFWYKLKEQKEGLVLQKNFVLPVTVYDEGVRSLISRELESFLKKPSPAQFAFDKKGAVYIVPEKIGEHIDREEVIALIKKKIASFDPAPANFHAATEIPDTTEAKLQPFIKLAEAIASHTALYFHYNGYKWKVSGPKLAGWLAIRGDGALGVNGEKLGTFLVTTVGAAIDDPPQNSRFTMSRGVLTEIIPGHPGSVLDIEKTAEKVEQTILRVQRSYATTGDLEATLASLGTEIGFNPKTGVIDIPVEVIVRAPTVTKETIAQYKIEDLVGISRTSFRGSSADRKTNIKIGVSKLNGQLIAPNEEFSAVSGIGYVTEAEGFVKEYVIKDNKSVKELGGGLCQLATTLFRAVLNAGLPVTERVNHRYVVGYYGAGLDATIYGPHPDLRFINDTGQYLLLQGRVEGTDVVLELYGQKDSRQVIISEPRLSEHIPPAETKYIKTPDLAFGVEKCSETPRAGVTADVTYRVGFPTGEVREQTFHSVYQPWGKICLVGTKK